VDQNRFGLGRIGLKLSFRDKKENHRSHVNPRQVDVPAKVAINRQAENSHPANLTKMYIGGKLPVRPISGPWG
jgi:hypothetical protein